MFNELLDARVQNETWNILLAGDTANLDGTGSVFDVDEIDDELLRRCQEMDIHPAGELIGDGSDTGPEGWLSALAKARVEKGTRSLRLRIAGLKVQTDDDAVVLSFSLGRGAFATAVLREIAQTTA